MIDIITGTIVLVGAGFPISCMIYYIYLQIKDIKAMKEKEKKLPIMQVFDMEPMPLPRLLSIKEMRQRQHCHQATQRYR